MPAKQKHQPAEVPHNFLIEKQQHQTNCVDNIMKVLKIDGANLQVDHDTLDKSFHQQNINKEKNQLDILMETGTGKTFTYLKTIFEIWKKFKKKKFIIILPRVAIKLGVIQNIKITDPYFYQEYSKHLNYIDYPQQGIDAIQQNFIVSNDLSIIITTNSAFNSEKNKINQKSEKSRYQTLQGFKKLGTTWEGIAAQQPVIIIDEPHLLKGSETQKGLAKLNDSLVIRFGATFPTEKEHHLTNIAYILDSITAFRQYHVKQIGVYTIFSENETSDLHIQKSKPPHSFEISYEINKQLQHRLINLKDDLGAKTELAEYQGKIVTKITSDKIYLNDGTELSYTSGSYQLTDSEIKEMVQCAIKYHFEKEEKLFERDIKALSLFFIPNINDFRGEAPRIKTFFEECYPAIRQEFYEETNNKHYREYLKKDFDETGKLLVHQGYFSGDKGTKETQEAKGIDIILNDKAKLLSFETPLRFIFSVWALQEGWDNPNIFTICKLANTNKETSRRQQVGRGLRIAVNKKGRRITYNHLQENETEYFEINELEIIVSHYEKNFIQAIQQEIQEGSNSIIGDITHKILIDKGLTEREASRLLPQLEDKKIIEYDDKNENYIIKKPIADYLKNNRRQLSFISEARFPIILKVFSKPSRNPVIDKNKLQKNVKIRPTLWKEFQQLWETINKKAKIVYKDIKQEKLIEDISTAFNKENIQKKQSTATKEIYDTQENTIKSVKESIFQYGTTGHFKNSSLQEFITQFAKDEKLPLNFVTQLFNSINQNSFKNDPDKAASLLKYLIKEQIHSTILQKIDYQFTETAIYPNSLQDKDGKNISSIKSSLLGSYYTEDNPPEHYLYDTNVYDSLIEEDCIKEQEQVNDSTITVFAKLPKINIPTPYKTYNPDFAYLIQTKNKKTLFLIVETKGYDKQLEIPCDEKKKIDYAKKFFKKLNQQFPEIDIIYKTRINKEKLSTILQGIGTGNEH